MAGGPFWGDTCGRGVGEDFIGVPEPSGTARSSGRGVLGELQPWGVFGVLPNKVVQEARCVCGARVEVAEEPLPVSGEADRCGVSGLSSSSIN